MNTRITLITRTELERYIPAWLWGEKFVALILAHEQKQNGGTDAH